MRIVFAAAIVPVLTVAQTQAAEFRFQGTFFITGAAGSCGDSEPVATEGDNYVFAYRLSDEGEAFALFDTRKAYQFEPARAGRFGASGTYTGAKIKSGADTGELAGKYSAFKVSPGTPRADSEQVLVTGKITNFDRNGCTVTFSASGAHRPGF
ncbi:hypothetical protein [Hansschlegelia zhihuaiae]|uniref:Uncharacterized protein n=1 Tax=Hansschlegelia zhihuaiae TaxID=405005 RepID=A0A4Q0MHX9_9HYPH|nr:hypothetical protein [Hansschlegelia zhihuaiae]RXF73140.1 hypothetical protein EK403_11675 [Hansschlegelia zhihuaiae]